MIQTDYAVVWYGAGRVKSEHSFSICSKNAEVLNINPIQYLKIMKISYATFP